MLFEDKEEPLRVGERKMEREQDPLEVEVPSEDRVVSDCRHQERQFSLVFRGEYRCGGKRKDRTCVTEVCDTGKAKFDHGLTRMTRIKQRQGN